MLHLFKKKEVEIFAPVDGTVMDLSQVPDKIFAQKMMGEGIAFQPSVNQVCAPCDGTIVLLAATSHAFGIKAENGAEILIHIGFDTVNLNGQGFQTFVHQGEFVTRGTVIIEFDASFMKANHMDLTTPMVITNSSDYDVKLQAYGKVKQGISHTMTCSKRK